MPIVAVPSIFRSRPEAPGKSIVKLFPPPAFTTNVCDAKSMTAVFVAPLFVPPPRLISSLRLLASRVTGSIPSGCTLAIEPLNAVNVRKSFAVTGVAGTFNKANPK